MDMIGFEREEERIINSFGEEDREQSILDARERLICDLNELYKVKNKLYGNSIDEVRTQVKSYTLCMLLNKVNRYKTLVLNDNVDDNGESIEDTLKDLINYALSELALLELDKR